MEESKNIESTRARALTITPAQMIRDSKTEGSPERYETEKNYISRALRPIIKRSRKFEALVGGLVSYDAYDYELPLIKYPRTQKGSSIYTSDLISEMINSKKGEFVNVADVGYGTGMALLEAAVTPEWSEKIKLYGIGFSNHAKNTITADQKTSMYDLLTKNGVELIESSVTSLQRSKLPQFDIIMCCNTFQYITYYPQWEVVRKLYSSLKVGGVIVLNGFGQTYSSDKKDGHADPLVISSDDTISEPWKQYFKALETIGCYVDTCDYLSAYRFSFGQLVIYKEAKINIPASIGKIKRPSDRLFREISTPTAFTDSIKKTVPNLGQRIDIALRKLSQNKRK